MLHCWKRVKPWRLTDIGCTCSFESPGPSQAWGPSSVFVGTDTALNACEEGSSKCKAAGLTSWSAPRYNSSLLGSWNGWRIWRGLQWYGTIRGCFAQINVARRSWHQQTWQGGKGNRRTSPVVAEFRSIVAERSILKQEKDLIAREVMKGPLTAREIAHIFNCMKKGNYMNEELLEHCAVRVLDGATHVKQLSPIELGMTIHSLAVMYDRSSQFFPCFYLLLGALLEECLERERSCKREFNEQGIANVVYALGLVVKRNAGFTQDMQLHDLTEVLLNKLIKGDGRVALQGCTEQGLANIVYGLAWVGYSNAGVLDALGSEIRQTHRLNTFTEQGLSNIVYGYGLLGDRNEAVLQALSNEIKQTHMLSKFTEQGLANIVYGFGLLKYYNEAVLDALANEILQKKRLKGFIKQHMSSIVYGFGLLGYHSEAVLDALSNEIRQAHRLEKLTEQGLSNIVYGLGLLKYYNEEVLDALANEIMQKKRLKTFKEQALSNIVYGFGLLGYHNEGVLGALADEIQQKKRLKEFNAQHLSNIVYGFGLLSDRWGNRFISDSTRRLLESMTSEISKIERMEEFSSQGLSNIAWGLGALQYLDASLMDLLIERFLVLAKLDHGVDKREITMLVYACAVLNIPHAAFLHFVDAWIDKNLINVEDPRDVTEIMWGLAVLRFLSPEQFQRMCTKLVEFGFNGLKHEDCGQLLQAYLHVQTLTSLTLDSQAAGLIEKAKVFHRAERSSGTSQFEMDVSRTLNELGIAHKMQFEIDEVCMVADILVEGQSQVIIEVDGPFHYAFDKESGAYSQLGDTMVRNRILQSMGFKVLCVPFSVWDSLGTEGKKQWLKEQLDTLQSS